MLPPAALYIAQQSLEARVLHRYCDNFGGNVLDLEIGCREGSRIPGPRSAVQKKDTHADQLERTNHLSSRNHDKCAARNRVAGPYADRQLVRLES